MDTRVAEARLVGGVPQSMEEVGVSMYWKIIVWTSIGREKKEAMV